MDIRAFSAYKPFIDIRVPKIYKVTDTTKRPLEEFKKDSTSETKFILRKNEVDLYA